MGRKANKTVEGRFSSKRMPYGGSAAIRERIAVMHAGIAHKRLPWDPQADGLLDGHEVPPMNASHGDPGGFGEHDIGPTHPVVPDGTLSALACGGSSRWAGGSKSHPLGPIGSLARPSVTALPDAASGSRGDCTD